jgi:heme/copper-type cytochrome/quinol oxidase subunit 2
MIAPMLPLADFGSDTTAAGWMTVVLPLVVLAVVFALWYRALRARARSGAGDDATPQPPSPRSDPPALQAVAPVLPAAVLPVSLVLALVLALALAAVVAAAWWRRTRHMRA